MSPWLPQSHEPVSLRRLFPGASFVGCADIRVTDVCEQSTQCTPQTTFAALPGTRWDGSTFVAEAIARGACSVLAQKPLPDVSVPQCVVADVRAAYAKLCEAVEQHPSQRLCVSGVTGTNGKTTTTYLIRSILTAAGHRTGLLGTVEYDDGTNREPSRLTTPDSRTLARWLGRMVTSGATHVTLELSSHALHQGRAAGTLLDAAVVTNVTHDHFDYHQTFSAYLDAKALLFEQCKPDALVVLNADDPGAASLRERVSHRRVTTFGLERPADVMAAGIEETLSGSRFRLVLEGDGIDVATRLVGRHNISNCLAAAAVTAGMGVELEDIAAGIANLDSVPGRLNRIDGSHGFHVFVDYAHTDDALRRCVQFLKRLTTGRVICVFGAGGDRDRTKRPLLGRAAAEADVAVVTSDNPRSEDPMRIIRDILEGLENTSCVCHVEADRGTSIRWALWQARPGDCVLVAGKGHEAEQIVGDQRLHFDDREIIRNYLSPSIQSFDRCRERIPA